MFKLVIRLVLVGRVPRVGNLFNFPAIRVAVHIIPVTSQISDGSHRTVSHPHSRPILLTRYPSERFANCTDRRNKTRVEDLLDIGSYSMWVQLDCH